MTIETTPPDDFPVAADFKWLLSTAHAIARVRGCTAEEALRRAIEVLHEEVERRDPSPPADEP